ncbi:MAG: aldose 1-epimerase [Betaproteobacteria bacterium]|nr:aldose 1-epimerase [Betaproteobacteria bacterium]
MTALELHSGNLHCALRPDLGGCLAGLWLGDEPVLRSTAPQALKSARESGCFPLVPFSNRIAQAHLQWQGTSHPLVRNNGDEPHAIHGVGWQRAWQVLEHTESSAFLSYEHRADSGWPFAFDASQMIQVQPNRLTLTLSITNQAHTAAPVGLGWHPYFVKRAHSQLGFQASGRWEMGADKLPTHRTAITGLSADCDTLDVDHCYDGWNGTLSLHDAVLQVHVQSSMRRLVVFTNPTRDNVAIEPVSHVNNAVHLVREGVADAQTLGLVVLPPGESMSATMDITVEPA